MRSTCANEWGNSRKGPAVAGSYAATQVGGFFSVAGSSKDVCANGAPVEQLFWDKAQQRFEVPLRGYRAFSEMFSARKGADEKWEVLPVVVSGLFVEGDLQNREKSERALSRRLLDPGQFVRVHRSAIVRIGEVEVILLRGGGDYAVRLESGKCLSVSRGHIEELENRLGVEVRQETEP